MQENNKKPLESLIDFTADKTIQMYKESSVLGTPAVNEDGSTVIPVSDLSIGFAAGGMNNSEKAQKGNTSGAGGKITAKPRALIIMNNGNVKIENIKDTKPSALSSALLLAKKLIKKKK